jgi:ABC-type sugar transport system ATPase subunit
MVFQNYALFPHLNVAQNIGFGLSVRGLPAEEHQARLTQVAELLGLNALLQRKPSQLSGGQQQRVALGRALVAQAKVCLMDEPLSNLDAALRAELRVELKKLLERLQATALYVTHDQVEAMTLSHRIAVLSKGKLEQVDTPRNIYQSPKSLFVAGFFGSPPMNLLEAEADEGQARVAELSVPLPRSAPGELVLGFRPEHVRLVPAKVDSAQSSQVSVRVTAVEPLGAETHLELALGEQLLRARAPGFEAPEVGSSVTISIDRDDFRWFDRKTGQAL